MWGRFFYVASLVLKQLVCLSISANQASSTTQPNEGTCIYIYLAICARHLIRAAWPSQTCIQAFSKVKRTSGKDSLASKLTTQSGDLADRCLFSLTRHLIGIPMHLPRSASHHLARLPSCLRSSRITRNFVHPWLYCYICYASHKRIPYKSPTP